MFAAPVKVWQCQSSQNQLLAQGKYQDGVASQNQIVDLGETGLANQVVADRFATIPRRCLTDSYVAYCHIST